MSAQSTNYRLLRFMGKFISVCSLVVLGIVVIGWVNTAFFGPENVRHAHPVEIAWLIPVFGVAFGEICRAVADIADRQ